jgi:hypothetical protein
LRIASRTRCGPPPPGVRKRTGSAFKSEKLVLGTGERLLVQQDQARCARLASIEALRHVVLEDLLVGLGIWNLHARRPYRRAGYLIRHSSIIDVER